MQKLFSIGLIIFFIFKVQAQSLDSTNLPLIIIDTHGMIIPDDNKITASMRIISNGLDKKNCPNDTGNIYSGEIGIEIRGRYSASLPQKPYGFETRDSFGQNLNVSLLDMPKENDWILLANYNDKSFVRNSLAFKIFRDMGHYAPRTKLCEVIVDDNYQGIYNLTEKIKIDNDRLNIDKLISTQNAGDELTGGYVFSIDYYDWSDSWLGSYAPLGYPNKQVYFVYNFPKPNEISPTQKTYIQNFVTNLEKNLYGTEFKDQNIGYTTYFDVQSFIDYFIVNELARNVDGYKKSCFYNKSRNSKGGKIAAGPIWDFDWAWKNIWDCSIFAATDGSGWAYKILGCDPWPTPTGWIPRLMQDPAFVDALKLRYTSLRKNILSNASLINYIDSVNTLIADAQVRHFQKWPILGENVGAPEVDPIPDTFEGETSKFKNWIITRLAWLDDQMLITSDPILPEFKNAKSSCTIFPNPTKDILSFTSNKPIHSVVIYNFLGEKSIDKSEIDSKEFEMNIKSLKPGLYSAKILLQSGEILSDKIAIE